MQQHYMYGTMRSRLSRQMAGERVETNNSFARLGRPEYAAGDRLGEVSDATTWWYVYTLHDHTGTIFYVGATKTPAKRCAQRCREESALSLRFRGGYMRIARVFSEHAHALAYESELIARGRGLLNVRP